MEVSRAPYETLLRVPGIGVKSARRIMAARRQGALTFEALRKMGVVLKRARHFITCQGQMEQGTRLDADYIARVLTGDGRRDAWEIAHREDFCQMSLFDDFHLN